MNETAAPTVALISLMCLACIASMKRMHCAVFDVPSAFLNAPMPDDGHVVDVLLDKTTATVLVSLRPELRKYLRKDGCLAGQLSRALYGTIQAAKLWYDTISSDLVALGFFANPYDKCVFSKIEADGKRTDICLYVDDFFVFASSDRLVKSLWTSLSEKYGKLTIHQGKKLEDLGMLFDYSIDGELKVSMPQYERDCIVEIGAVGNAATPAGEDLFITKRPDDHLSTQDSRKFHTCVAKLLYLAKRTRPEILLAVGYLTTRVHHPAAEDWDKLVRIGNYLNANNGLGIRFAFDGSSEIVSIIAAIDAAYGVHVDGKSHSGLVVSLGGGPILVSSSKQKTVTKSSHEAELLSLSDSASHVLWSREFVLSLGYESPAAIIHRMNEW